LLAFFLLSHCIGAGDLLFGKVEIFIKLNCGV
jgi:hypothetical protein